MAMVQRIRTLILTSLFFCIPVWGQWVELTQLTIKEEVTELGGPRIVFSYGLESGQVSREAPVYVFVRYRPDSDHPWLLLPAVRLTGNGYGLVDHPGRKTISWWGSREAGLSRFESARFQLFGLAMCRVPEGKFHRMGVPGQGRDESEAREPVADLPEYFIARNETTIQMYADYLNQVGREGWGWKERMADRDRCGIERLGDGTYQVVPGREDYPVTYVSWYDAVAFLQWCGLRLPTEGEFEKAIRGGLYLDGDQSRGLENPLPSRRFPWGDEEPGSGGKQRCNYDGGEDGFEFTAPVGSFAPFNSPLGVADLVGNVAEWTEDWYSTSFHAGLDGFRVVRGGSWMDVPDGCDAVSGATQLPMDESGIIGFRGAYSR